MGDRRAAFSERALAATGHCNGGLMVFSRGKPPHGGLPPRRRGGIHRRPRGRAGSSRPGHTAGSRGGVARVSVPDGVRFARGSCEGCVFVTSPGSWSRGGPTALGHTREGDPLVRGGGHGAPGGRGRGRFGAAARGRTPARSEPAPRRMNGEGHPAAGTDSERRSWGFGSRAGPTRLDGVLAAGKPTPCYTPFAQNRPEPRGSPRT